MILVDIISMIYDFSGYYNDYDSSGYCNDDDMIIYDANGYYNDDTYDLSKYMGESDLPNLYKILIWCIDTTWYWNFVK